MVNLSGGESPEVGGGQTYEDSMINNLSDNVICNIYADGTTPCSKCDQASYLWQQLEMASELESDLWHTLDWGHNLQRVCIPTYLK